MKTIAEIKVYCRDRCIHTECRGKHLKLAKRNRKFYGITLVRKGEYYCDISINSGGK